MGTSGHVTAFRDEIEVPRGEFTGVAMMRDYDSLTSLFTHDGVLPMPGIPAPDCPPAERSLVA